MSIIKENFDKLIAEKELPAEYLEIEGGHHLYRFRFGVTPVRDLIVEVIVQKLENGDVALEEAIAEFQKGMKLSKELQASLDKAEKTLVKVMQADGTETEME